MAKLSRISSETRIRQAEKLLRERLQGAAGDPIPVRVGYQGGQSRHEAWWIAEAEFWFVTAEIDTRWWNGFGLGEPEADGPLSLTVEVNPPRRGDSRRVGGAFLADSTGTIYLAHTGKIGGGRKGIGKRQFLSYFPGTTVEVDGAEYILIGAIEEDDFVEKLGDFVRTVDRFKREVVEGQVSTEEHELEDHEAPSYWKIAADSGSHKWDDWEAGNYIAIGWNELGDLSDVDSEEYEERVQALLAEHSDWKRQRLDQVWRFATQIQEGARVVVNRGTSRVLAFGTVTGEYHFDPDAWLGHRIPVRWDDTDERVVERGGWRRTLIKLERSDFEELLRAPKVVEDEDESGDDAIDAESGLGFNFDDLVAHLGDLGLRFDGERIASYLLALQSKRFVILSGISGTGKTKLALEVARRLAPRRAEAKTSTEGTRVTVRPYMLKYRRFVVPKAIADELDAFGAFDAKELHVYYGAPDEEEQCKLRISSGQAAHQLLFRGEFRAWFEDTFDEGDELALSIYVNDDDTASLVVNDASEVDDEEDAPTGGPSYRVVAVRPDWTDNRGLLGYYNPITARYQSTPFLELLLAAAAELRRAEDQGRAAEPYFVILDEMNLARVEHYFSDFLSSMESGEPLHLHDDTALAEGVSESGEAIPRELEIPRNLFFTGTVNVDETTYMFSPKVLDRAFVLEFNEVDLRGYGHAGEVDDEDGDLDLLHLTGFDGRLGLRSPGGQVGVEERRGDAHRPGPRDWKVLRELADGQFADTLASLNELLAVDHRHFGYRVANEIARFMRLAAEQIGRGEESLWAAFDIALLAKVLPKLHGTEQELRGLLERLLGFAVAGEPGGRQVETHWTLERGALSWAGEGEAPDLWLPRTSGKLWRMLRQLRLRGFVSFIE